MTTVEAVAYLNQSTPYFAMSLNGGTVIVYSGCEHGAEMVARLWAASDELLAKMVMAFVEVTKEKANV